MNFSYTQSPIFLKLTSFIILKYIYNNKNYFYTFYLLFGNKDFSSFYYINLYNAEYNVDKWKFSFPIDGLHDVIKQKDSISKIDEIITQVRLFPSSYHYCFMNSTKKEDWNPEFNEANGFRCYIDSKNGSIILNNKQIIKHMYYKSKVVEWWYYFAKYYDVGSICELL